MPRIADTKKSQELKRKGSDPKKAGSTRSGGAPVFAPPWETSLLKVYGKSVSLSYPMPEAGTVTTSYLLSPTVVPLQEGVTIKPGKTFGQVSVYDDETTRTRSVIFNATGGELRFAPPNLNGVHVTGELAVATLVREESLDAAPHAGEDGPVTDTIPLPALDQEGLDAQSPEGGPVPEEAPLPALEQAGPELYPLADAPETDRIDLPPMDDMALENGTPLPVQTPGAPGTIEASASLAKPLVIRPLDGFQMELGDLEYAKRRNDLDPKLTFYKTRLTYQTHPVAPDFETESDSSGLHLPGNLPLALDGSTLAEAGFAGAQGRSLELELWLDRNGASIRERNALQEEQAEEPQELAAEEPQVTEEPSVAEEEPQAVEEETLLITEDEDRLDEEEAAEEEEEVEEAQDLITDDGFLQVEHPHYDALYNGDDPTATHGTGAFKFLSIPYDITVPRITRGGRASQLRGATEEVDCGDDTDFTVSADGRINAELQDPVELPMEKAPLESDAVIKTLTLMDAAVADNVLTAKHVRIDRGLQLESEQEDGGVLEDARKLFGTSLKGTIADVDGAVEVHPGTGITGETGKKQLAPLRSPIFSNFWTFPATMPPAGSTPLSTRTRRTRRSKAGTSSARAGI